MATRGRPRTFDPDTALRASNWTCSGSGATRAPRSATWPRRWGSPRPASTPASAARPTCSARSWSSTARPYGEPPKRALTEHPTARAAIHAMLRATADQITRPDAPHYCMLILAAPTGAVENHAVREFLADIRRSQFTAIEDRLAAASPTATSPCRGRPRRHRPLLRHRGAGPVRPSPRRRHPRRAGGGHHLRDGRLGHPHLRGRHRARTRVARASRPPSDADVTDRARAQPRWSRAQSAALVRSATPIRRNTLPTCAFTVRSVMPSRRAICLLARPCATSESTSRSRGLRSAAGAVPAARDGVGSRAPRDPGVEGHVALGGRAHRGEQGGGVGVLEQVADGAGVQRLPHPLLVGEAGEHDDAGAGQGADDLAGRLDAVHHRHRQVHQHDVGRGLDGERRRPHAPSAACPHTVEVGDAVDEAGESGAHELVVVDEQHGVPRRGASPHLQAPAGALGRGEHARARRRRGRRRRPAGARRSARARASPAPGRRRSRRRRRPPRARTAPSAARERDVDAGRAGVAGGVAQRLLRDLEHERRLVVVEGGHGVVVDADPDVDVAGAQLGREVVEGRRRARCRRGSPGRCRRGASGGRRWPPRTAAAASSSETADSASPFSAARLAAPATTNEVAASSCTTPSCSVAAIRRRSASEASRAACSSCSRSSPCCRSRRSSRHTTGSSRSIRASRLPSTITTKPRRISSLRVVTTS